MGDLIVWISRDAPEDARLLGGKGAGLVKLIKLGLNVPPGFIVTTRAFERFMEAAGLKERVAEILASVQPEDPSSLRELERRVRSLIEAAPLPRELIEALRRAYDELRRRVGGDPLLAVRSSATAEDLELASFAGQLETALGVRGFDELVKAVKRVWSSLYTARAIAYRAEKGVPQTASSMAVIVQKLVEADAAGVAFTIHPATGSGEYVVIEASVGLGEAVVKGEVTPDIFVVRKSDLALVEERVSEKAVAYVVRDGRVVKVRLEGAKAREPSLPREKVVELARAALEIERAYGRPVDVEWAVEDGVLYILQARPETVWSRAERLRREPSGPPAARVLVRGVPASPGVATGVARVVLSPDSEEARRFREGEVLVTRMTDPDWVPLMRKAAAIVTDEGGMTSHAAIVSRELGIPAVVGTREATKIIRTGMVVTVDGSRGVVYEGAVGERAPERRAGAEVLPMQPHAYPATATKIYMNLGEPDAIDKYLHLPFDGIGLMRIEFILSSWIGYHPLYALESGREDEYVRKLAEGIARVASAVYPRPVVVRFSDFKTNEYRKLRGGERFEPDERNPMIGWRGVSRYIHPRFEKAFRLEVRAVLRVREDMGYNNVWVMLPFVRTTWELERALKIMEDEGLRRSRDFKVWVMAEVPSVVLLAEEFARYVDGFSIGSNDLTQLVLGVDRDSAMLAEMGYFDERDPAVLKAIAMLIEKAHRMGRTVSICGQAPSVYPELVEFLVEHGIDSISVNPDAVIPTRMLVASVERRVMLKRLERLEEAIRELSSALSALVRGRPSSP